MKFTVVEVIVYPIGVVLMLLGGLILAITPLGGLIVLATGVFALPVVRDRIDDRFDGTVSRWLVTLIIVVGTGIGFGVTAISANW